MNRALKIAAGVTALGFICVGLCWWIAPAAAGALVGMTLLGGAGLSTQIADLGGFFLLLGCAIWIGLATSNRAWLYAPVLLLAFAIVGRLIAWFFHGAEFTFILIAAEAVVISILLLNVRAFVKQTP